MQPALNWQDQEKANFSMIVYVSSKPASDNQRNRIEEQYCSGNR